MNRERNSQAPGLAPGLLINLGDYASELGEAFTFGFDLR
jgi:hypothetical protein